MEGNLFDEEVATFRPAIEAFELRTVLLIGDYGNHNLLKIPTYRTYYRFRIKRSNKTSTAITFVPLNLFLR